MDIQIKHLEFVNGVARIVPSVRQGQPEQDLVEFSLRVAVVALAAAAVLATLGAYNWAI